MKNNIHTKSTNQKLINFKYLIQKSTQTDFLYAGSHSSIHRAKNIETDQIVALKESKIQVGPRGVDSTSLRQRDLLNSLKHKNIVPMIESFIFEQRVYIVYPYFKKNLKEFLAEQYGSEIPIKIVKKIMNQLLSALKVANQARFMHRDIKMENVMVEFQQSTPELFTIKLADWGSSRKFNINKTYNFTKKIIPQIYRPPEMLFGSNKYSQNVDIWSMGCLFYQLLTGGQRLFNQVSESMLLFEIMQKIGISDHHDENWLMEMYEELNLQCYNNDFKSMRGEFLFITIIKNSFARESAYDLLKKMLKINPRNRISVYDALKHRFFDLNN